MGMILLFFVLSLLNGTQALTELSLIGKTARQSETWSDRVANLAIDGNDTSFSVAASPGNSSALGWWEVDLGDDYQIGQVNITASFEDYNAKYLQNFSIVLINKNGSQHLCYEYSSSVNLKPSETKLFPCPNDPFLARFVRIKRLGGDFRPDGMALAEVKVFIGFNAPDQIEAPSPNEKELSLIGKTARQSETWSDRVANLAIDGNDTSFSVAASPGNSSALGWWEVDLSDDYQIGQVNITASFEDYNAKYLQHFSIVLLDENRTEHLCYEYNFSEYFTPSEWKSFPCSNDPFKTRYIRIKRLGGDFRPDGLALAEVRVITGFNAPDKIDAPFDNGTTTPPSHQGYRSELPLVGKKSRQSETWYNKVADLAIDGNYGTFSIAASPSNSSALGWWEVDLEGVYWVVEVWITSSYEEYNAHYLQNFRIQLISADRSSSSSCFDYLSTDSIPPNQTRSFSCNSNNFPASYVRVERLGGPFRQDAISLAEVQVFVSYNQSVPDKIYDSDVGGYEVSLGGLKTHQSNTWGDHLSSLAIDNDPNTFTISCVTCNNTLASGVGWWQIDFGIERPITSVVLTSSLDEYNSNYFQNIIIALTSSNTSDLANARICYTFDNSSNVPAGTTLFFKCIYQPTWGRFLIIKRMENAPFRPDALAIAEFKVFETTPTSPPSPIINDSNTTGTIAKSTIQAVQSSTFDNHNPLLALDDDPNTFTSAISSNIIPYWSPVAWWQADLGAFYNVTQVDITSPLDDQYARHLESFSIDIYPKSIFEDPSLPGAIQCIYYPVDKYILPGVTEKFTCIAPNYGRYLIVRKVWKTNSIPQFLSFAEITIHYK